MPIVGVAKAGWTLEQLRARARDSLEHHGELRRGGLRATGDAAGLCRRRLQRPADLPRAEAGAGTAPAAAALSGDPARAFRRRRVGARHRRPQRRCAARGRKAVRARPRNRPARSTRRCTSHFPEETIFRIDHYLGKEPVQNILYTRFANSMFEPLWNRSLCPRIQITMAESFGVEDRGSFYDAIGALRDVVQNHMLQVAGEPDDGPADRGGSRGDPRPEGRALEGGPPARRASVVRGQYRGYRAVPGVRPDSAVETFVALSCSSTAGAGRACRSTSAPANACRRRRPKSWSSSTRPPRATFGDEAALRACAHAAEPGCLRRAWD